MNRIADLLNGHSSNGHHHPVPATALEEKQALLAHMVRLVARKVTNGLFAWGSGGTGKSKVISETLAHEGICPVLCNSHITALSLYQSLYEHRQDAILWLDDVDGIFSSLPVLGLLRSALWHGGGGARIVTYSSTQLKNMPSRFTFSSRIIFCANMFPRNKAVEAMLSRIDVFHLALSNEEVIEHMQFLARQGFSTLTPEDCLAVVEFIAQAGGTRQLSMRLYEPSLRKVEYARHQGIDWKDLVRCQLDQVGGNEVQQQVDSRAFHIQILEQAIAAHPDSVSDQQDFWCAATGKSRATFFRVKRAYDEEKGAA